MNRVPPIRICRKFPPNLFKQRGFYWVRENNNWVLKHFIKPPKRGYRAPTIEEMLSIIPPVINYKKNTGGLTFPVIFGIEKHKKNWVVSYADETNANSYIVKFQSKGHPDLAKILGVIILWLIQEGYL